MSNKNNQIPSRDPNLKYYTQKEMNDMASKCLDSSAKPVVSDIIKISEEIDPEDNTMIVTEVIGDVKIISETTPAGVNYIGLGLRYGENENGSIWFNEIPSDQFNDDLKRKMAFAHDNTEYLQKLIDYTQSKYNISSLTADGYKLKYELEDNLTVEQIEELNQWCIDRLPDYYTVIKTEYSTVAFAYLCDTIHPNKYAKNGDKVLVHHYDYILIGPTMKAPEQDIRYIKYDQEGYKFFKRMMILAEAEYFRIISAHHKENVILNKIFNDIDSIKVIHGKIISNILREVYSIENPNPFGIANEESSSTYLN